MTKKQIGKLLADRTGTTDAAGIAAVGVVLRAIRDALARGERVELRGFGAFDVADRKAGRRRNPRTGGTVDVPARRVVRFKPGKVLAGRADVAVSEH